MARFLLRRFFLTVLTLVIISIIIFVLVERAPGNIARNVLGNFATPEQEASFLAQMGFDRSLPNRYIAWLLGSDWQVEGISGLTLSREVTPLGFEEWRAIEDDGVLVRWEAEGADLIAIRRLPDGTLEEVVENDRWTEDEAGTLSFWGVDNNNRAVKWQFDPNAAEGEEITAVRYIPLQKGFLRGDPGVSLRTRRPVTQSLFRSLRNSLLLAGVAFVIVMPLALALGLLAGLNEGKPLDRILSLGGLITTSTPEFATGVILILIFASWLEILPGAAVFSTDDAPFRNPELVVLPILTLTLIELGYVLRITRSSIAEVMNEPYIQAASLKGLSRRRIVFHHALRNALIAPITVITLHVNWLIGGIVVVEAIFGFPGLGNYLLSAALFKDVFAIEAGAILMITLAMSSQLVADILYVLLNPRIRYA